MSNADKQVSKPKKKRVRKISQAEESLTKLVDEAKFLDRQILEAALYERPSFGISNKEPELELGRRLQMAREDAKLTQGELAELTKKADSSGIGLSRAVISMYEVGKNRPSPRELRILCESLRTSPNKLIYGDDDPFDALTERGRYDGFSRSDPEFNALLSFAFHNLHHHHKIDIMHIMMGLLRGWDKRWFDDKSDDANKHLLEMAEALKALLEKRSQK